MFRFSFLGLLFLGGIIHSAYAENLAIRSNDAIRDIPVMQNDTATRYDLALCARYLALDPNSHHLFQSGVGSGGQKIAKADIDLFDILGAATEMQLQPSPASQSKTTKATETVMKDGITTTTETLSKQNSVSVASATPIAVRLDHKSGLLSLNGKVASEFEKRQLQEACQSAIQR